MVELSIADLAKKTREPTFSVRQQAREKGTVMGVPVKVFDDAGRTKVRVSDEAASRLNLVQPKSEERPNPEPEAVEQSRPNPPEQSKPEPAQATPEPKPIEEPETQATPESVEVEVEVEQPVIYEPKESKPERKTQQTPTRENPSPGGGAFLFALGAAAVLSIEPVRREVRNYFTDHDDWTRRF